MKIKSKELPSVEYLNECFLYNEETGSLTWKKRPLHHFKNKISQYMTWNRIYSDTIAGGNTRKSKNGESVYRVVYVNNKKYQEHRIIFKLINGYDPELIDHLNGIRNDNKISNLKSVNSQENSKNRRLAKNNTSGVLGVRFHNIKKRYVAETGKKSKMFKTFEEAYAYRKAWEKENNYHENHGREITVA